MMPAIPTINFKRKKDNPMNLQKLHSQPRFYPFKTKPLYRHRLYNQYFYTDEVREMMFGDETRNLVEHIFELQEEGAFKQEGLQYWDFKNLKNGYVILMCRNHQGRELYFKHVHAPNAKIQNISFILRKNILDLVF